MEATITKYTDRDRAVWESLYRGNPALSAYQSPDFVAQYLKTARLGKRRAVLRSEILRFDLEGGQIICPLAIDGRRKEVFLLGDFSAVGYCDLIYGADVTDEQLDAAIAGLQGRYPGYTLKFNKVNESSALCGYLGRRGDSLAQSECVCVSLGSDYDAYYKALSKNARQNIRTAYNRMNRDGKAFDFQIVQGTDRLTKKQKDDIIRVYCTRMKDKFGSEVLPYPIMYTAQRYFNPIVRSLNTLDNQFHALLYIDGELAAFLSGLRNGDGKRIVVPRLSMNGKFDFYDPGIVLLKETAEYLCREYPDTELDLSRGNEKYKYTMGGKPHYNHSFVI